MRHVLALTIVGMLAAPAAATAQPVSDIPPPAAAETPAEAPPVEFVQPEQPDQTLAPTTVQGVTVQADTDKKKDDKVKKKVAVTAGGLIGGLAGAAGGPIGKIAGSFVGKSIAKTVVGGDKKDDKDEPKAEAAPAADQPPALPTTNAVAVTDTPSLGDPAPPPKPIVDASAPN